MSMEYFHRKHLYDRERVSVLSTTTTGTASKYNATASGAVSSIEQPSVGAPTAERFRASAAIVETIDGDIWYTLDGSTPSASSGQKLNSGQTLSIAGYNKIKNLAMVRQAGTDVAVDISYYRG